MLGEYKGSDDYIFAEFNRETTIVRNLLAPANWPVKVTPALARSENPDGFSAWLCVQHTNLGLMTRAEHDRHQKAAKHNDRCFTCRSGDIVRDDEPMGIQTDAGDYGNIKVRVTWEDGTTEEAGLLGGSTIWWSRPWRYRCASCIHAAAEAARAHAEHEARQAAKFEAEHRALLDSESPERGSESS